jgi:hypothetical protein
LDALVSTVIHMCLKWIGVKLILVAVGITMWRTGATSIIYDVAWCGVHLLEERCPSRANNHVSMSNCREHCVYGVARGARGRRRGGGMGYGVAFFVAVAGRRAAVARQARRRGRGVFSGPRRRRFRAIKTGLLASTRLRL